MSGVSRPAAFGVTMVALLAGFGAGWWGRGQIAPPERRRGGGGGGATAFDDDDHAATKAAAAARPEAWAALTPQPADRKIATGPFPNLLVLVADDVGVDMVSGYGEHPAAPPTPNIDALANQGVRFTNAITDPLCSPSRAELLTGRYAYRYGIGSAIAPKPGWDLPTTERTLARMLKEDTGGKYVTYAIGKWHLASPDRGGWDHPRKMGFDHHLGTMGNLLGYMPGDAMPQTYFHWQHVEDGKPTPADGYITSATVDDAVKVIHDATQPWFVYVAFHAAHFPMHEPPAELLKTPLPAKPTEPQLYRAMVEAMDTEIGRLLASMPPEVRANTDIVFLGDNGSAPSAVLPPWVKTLAKGSLSRGGVRVPFIVSGPDVAAHGAVADALINSTDLYATIAELLHLDEPRPADSVSFAKLLADPTLPSQRPVAYAERFGPNGMDPWPWHESMIQDLQYKLLMRNGEQVGLFDVRTDPFEQKNLLDRTLSPDEKQAMRRLHRALPDAALVPREGSPQDDKEGG